MLSHDHSCLHPLQASSFPFLVTLNINFAVLTFNEPRVEKEGEVLG